MTPHRRVIHAPGLEHRSPLPVGVAIGDLILSSAITGKDPSTGLYDAPESQIPRAFENADRFLEAAGITRDEIGRVTLFMQNLDDRQYVDPVWKQWFPDPENRPARHAVPADLSGFHDGLCLQIEITAVRRPAVTDQ